jgi:predicted ATPase
MFRSIKYHNFKVLRDATLPLGRFTLLVGIVENLAEMSSDGPSP